MSDPSLTHVRIDFDRLVREYLDNLQINLRSFQAAESFGFLDTWVPHDDPTENLLELVELAREAGLARLTVVLAEATNAALDMPHIERAAGPPTRRRTPQGHELEFALDVLPRVARPLRAIETSRLSATADPVPSVRHEPPTTVEEAAEAADGRLEIHPCYRVALDRVLGEVRHHQRPEPVAGLEEVAARHGDWELFALVHPKSTVIKHVGFLGTGSQVQRGLMETLCRTMEERPIQECADHGAIAVEHALRDKKRLPPVLGVVTPDNADPAFQLPQQIVRRLLAEYRARTGYAATQNFFDRPPSPRWIELSDQQRRDAIEQALASYVDLPQVQLVRIDGLKRVVVRFTATLPSDRQQELLVQLEVDLRQTVESTLQLTTQVRVDANILRKPEQKK